MLVHSLWCAVQLLSNNQASVQAEHTEQVKTEALAQQSTSDKCQRLQVFAMKSEGVPIPVAVVWCRPYSDQLLVEHHLVAFHDKLMRPRNQFYFICLAEMLTDVAPKEIPSPPGTQTPPLNLFRITPQQITHGTIMWHLLFSINGAYLQHITRHKHMQLNCKSFDILRVSASKQTWL